MHLQTFQMSKLGRTICIYEHLRRQKHLKFLQQFFAEDNGMVFLSHAL